jgi:hypothetical protein
MIRVGSGRVVPTMTSVTFRGGPFEFPILMAGNTCCGFVHPAKRERCEIMVEALSPGERRYAMTFGTFR